MIGLKFLFRVGEFLLALGIISVIIVLVWYVMTKAVMWVVDRIEESNSDFAIWFRPKLRKIIKKKN